MTPLRLLSAAALVLAVSAAAIACSDDETTPTGGDGGTTTPPATPNNPPGSGNGDGGGGGDGGGNGNLLNNCRAFADQTADDAAREIVWDFVLVSAQPESRCLKIKAGQTVTFVGQEGAQADFVTHPRMAKGGDTPNPFSTAGTTPGVTFESAGTFGYVCGQHGGMTGAVMVVEE